MTPLQPRGAKFRFTCAQPRASGVSRNRIGRDARAADVCKRRTVVLRAADNTTSERLTVDMRQFVEETQKNILELNKSRLKALEEASQERKKLQLKDAKISDLMSKIAELEAENMELKEKISMSPATEIRSDIPASKPAPMAAPAPAHVPQQQQQHQQHQQQQQQHQQQQHQQQHRQQQQQQERKMASTPTPAQAPPPPAAAQAVASSNAGTISLHYATGWPDVFLHFNADNKGWSKSPGKRMELGPRGFLINLDASRVEFVLTNGKNEWDRPNPYSQKPTNYFIDGPGEYILKSGRVHKI